MTLTVTAVVLYAMVILVGILLIGLVLIQPSKSGGLGASFGGVGESVFGGKAGSHLTKMTVILSSIFFFLVLVLAVLVSHGGATAEHESAVGKTLQESTITTAVDSAVASDTKK